MIAFGWYPRRNEDKYEDISIPKLKPKTEYEKDKSLLKQIAEAIISLGKIK